MPDRNWLAWSRLRQKRGHFLRDEAHFVGRSSATVKNICEVWRKMGHFGPNSVPPNQLCLINMYQYVFKTLVFPGLLCCHYLLIGQTTGQPPSLTGRWEVVAYSEQGISVDKKMVALPQALAVYQHIRTSRARTWFGIDPDDEQGKRRTKLFERWEERDSIREVARIAEAIETPYFAVFFADSTLSLYNKNERTQEISFPEGRRYVFRPSTKSIDIFSPGPYGSVQWKAQILLLTETELTLFLPEEAEVVRLVKTAFTLP